MSAAEVSSSRHFLVGALRLPGVVRLIFGIEAPPRALPAPAAPPATGLFWPPPAAVLVVIGLVVERDGLVTMCVLLSLR